MAPRNQIVETFRKYLGVRWVHMGRDRRHGLDCGGVIAVVCQDLKIPYSDYVGWYSPQADGESLMRIMQENFREIDESEVQPGSMIVCGVRGLTKPGEERTIPHHLFIVTETEPEWKILHASNKPSHMRVVEHPLPKSTRGMISGAFDFYQAE